MTLKLSTDVHAPKCADKFCSFGIIEGIGAAIIGGLASVGVTGAVATGIATVGSYALVGAGAGALTAAVTGGKVLKGAGYGALIGGGIGLGAVAGGVGYEGGLSSLVGGGGAAGAAAEGAPGALTEAGAAAAPEVGTATAEQIASQIPGGLAGASGEAAGTLAPAAGSVGSVAPQVGGALTQAAPELVNAAAPAVAGAAPAAAPTLAQIGTPSILSGAETVAAAPAGIAGAPGGLAAYGGASPGFLSSLGLTKGDLIKGALSAAGSVMSGGQQPPPGPESTAATRGPYFDMPVKSSGYVNRQLNQQYQPAGGDWYHFGEKPQQNFYANNKLDLGYARGGALSTRGRRRPSAPPPQQNPNRYVSGGGDGVSDDVPAQLSDGEYVLTAADVSRIGNGSSSAGVKKLDRMRQMVAKDAGARKIQGRVKEPQSYLRQAAMGR